jgi:type I restriction-modification system DNA methylase subunit
VIVRFAEDHLVIPPGTLRQFYELRRSNPYTHSMDEYLDQFFRRFDKLHNSALFALGTVDTAAFSDDVLLPLISKLYEARYRSMPADIIGNTYEQYLGKALVLDNGSVTTRDNLETRKKQGSYYTPQVIVRYLVDTTLGRYLYDTVNGQPDGDPVDGEYPKTSRDIRHLRVLDSACGSGSFLIYAYKLLSDFYVSVTERLK